MIDVKQEIIENYKCEFYNNPSNSSFITHSNYNFVRDEKWEEYFENNYYEQTYSFENITFIEEFKICAFNFDVLFIFKNCIFENIFDIKKTVITELQIFNIQFINCTFKKSFRISGKTALTNIHFLGDCKIKSIEILGFNIRIGTLSLWNAQINTFYLRSLKCLNFILDNCVINEYRICRPLQEIYSLFNNFEVKDSTFEKFEIQQLNFEKIHFESNKFNNTFKIGELNCIDDISENNQYQQQEQCFYLSNNEFKREVNINIQKIKKVRLKNNQISEIFKIKGKEVETTEIEMGYFDAGGVIFSDYSIKQINISGNNQKQNVNFERIKFEKLNIEDFTNYSNVNFYSCEALKVKDETSCININNSHLGKTNFFDFNFDSFDEIKIQNSVLTEIVASNVVWFKPEKLNIVQKTEKTIKYLKNQREIYRQLKQATEKQGDKIQSLEFQAQELKVFEQEVKKIGTLNDKIIFALSWTNNFGLDWTRAFGLLLGSTFVFAGLIMNFGCSNDFSKTKEYVSFFEVLINMFYISQPLNKVTELKLNVFGQFLDVIHKLGFAFFSVQIISAFRKYVKTSS